MVIAIAHSVAVAAIASRSGDGVDAFSVAKHAGAIALPGLLREGRSESSAAMQNDEGEGEDGECETVAFHDFVKMMGVET